MKNYKHLIPEWANRITKLANSGKSQAEIIKATGLGRKQVSNCLSLSKKVLSSRPRKGRLSYEPIVKYTYSFDKWKEQKTKKLNAKIAIHNENLELKHEHFCSFVKRYYESQIVCGYNIARSCYEYICKYRIEFPEEYVPSVAQFYNWINKGKYGLKKYYFPYMCSKKIIKVQKIQVRPKKYDSIHNREEKSKLRMQSGNLEIDSVIGKRTDKVAVATVIDISTMKVRLRLYNRDSESFKNAIQDSINSYHYPIKTITIDNGCENNKLGEISPWIKIYNCDAYCSWQKGTIENMHRLIRRIIPKNRSFNNLSVQQLLEIEKFVNEYSRKYSPTN